MSKLRVRQDADGVWIVTGHYAQATGYGMTQKEAWRDMTSTYWNRTAAERLCELNQARRSMRQLKTRNQTLIAALVAQFVVIVATGVIMWIGG